MASLQLKAWEMFHLQELILFQGSFEAFDMGRELYQKKAAQDPTLALMRYDVELLETTKSDSNNQRTKGVIISGAVDKIIEKVKAFVSIREAFSQPHTEMQLLRQSMKSKFFAIEEAQVALKSQSRFQHKKLFHVLHEAQLSLATYMPQSTYCQNYASLHESLFSPLRLSRYNMSHFHTDFFVTLADTNHLKCHNTNQRQYRRFHKPLHNHKDQYTLRTKLMLYQTPLNFQSYVNKKSTTSPRNEDDYMLSHSA